MRIPQEDKHFREVLCEHEYYQRRLYLMAMAYAQNRTRKRDAYALAIDVGAHIGLASRDFATMFRNVIAIEPVAENFECLTANVPPNVHCIHAAAHWESKRVGFVNPSPANSGAWEMVDGDDVQTISIDALYSEGILNPPVPPSLIKIDVQGAEMDVLRGARETITEHRCTVVVEVDNSTEDEIVGYLLDCGLYPLSRLRGDVLFLDKGMKGKYGR